MHQRFKVKFEETPCAGKGCLFEWILSTQDFQGWGLLSGCLCPALVGQSGHDTCLFSAWKSWSGSNSPSAMGHNATLQVGSHGQSK